KSAKAWATAQGLSVLPVTLVGFFVVASFSQPAQVGWLGLEPIKFALSMVVAGVVCSWVGAALWNAMSQRLPPALGGQMIVFETIFSVVYALCWRSALPSLNMVIGMAMLLGGVLAALRVFRNEKA
ncbi:MAG TPA: EamA/RhaT family transporter, partial [Candidatus Aphodousia faecipullorum]|nr:EamA/RhaT family transporter [Candidatus Aphodousia faecipullorum]